MSDFKRDFQANSEALLIQGRRAFAAAAARAEGRIGHGSAGPPPSKEATTILDQGYLHTARLGVGRN